MPREVQTPTSSTVLLSPVPMAILRTPFHDNPWAGCAKEGALPPAGRGRPFVQPRWTTGSRASPKQPWNHRQTQRYPHGHRPRQRGSSQCRETPHSVQAALFPRATHGKTFDVHGQMLGLASSCPSPQHKRTQRSTCAENGAMGSHSVAERNAHTK